MYFYEGSASDYVSALAAVIWCYVLLSLIGTAVYGWFASRERWYSGRCLTGYIGAGDGSLIPGVLERLMIGLGFPSAAPDLYYFDTYSEERAAMAPIPIPQSLSQQGIRGRSDDPLMRKSSVLTKHPGSSSAACSSRVKFQPGREKCAIGTPPTQECASGATDVRAQPVGRSGSLHV